MHHLPGNIDQYHKSRSVSHMDSKCLWEIASNQNLLLILREPALIELAIRKDSRVVSCSYSLLEEGGIDEWYLGIQLLCILATDQAIKKILSFYAYASNQDRKLVIRMLSRIITKQRTSKFRESLKQMASSELIGSEEWKNLAIQLLLDVCSELGIVSEVLSTISSSRQEEDSRYSRRQVQNY